MARSQASRASPAERRARRAAVSDPEEVLAAGLRRLEVRAFSVDGLRRRLVEAGYRADLVEGALGHLAALGLLDDVAFARTWVESRDRARPRGAAALRRELAQHGVDREVIAGVLAERAGGGETSDEAEERAAAALLERRASSLAKISDPRLRRQRAYALLARSGFDPDTAARLAGRVGGGEPPE